MILLTILGYIILFIFVLAALLLLIPIKYDAEGHRSSNVPLSVKARLVYGGISYKYNAGTDCGIVQSFSLFCIPINKRHKSSKGSKNSRKENKKTIESKKKRMQIGTITGEAFIKQVLKSAKHLLGHVGFRKCKIAGVFGFEDPYNTAMVWLIINSLSLDRNGMDIRLSPVFDDEILEGDFNIQGSVIPAVVAYIALRFILSKPFKNIMKKKKERKNYVNKFKRKREHQHAV